MLSSLFRTGVFIFIGFWLKPRWKGIAILCFGISLIWIIHSEFLTYSVIGEGSLSVGWSYVYKWAAILLSVLIYSLFVELPLRAKRAKDKTGYSGSKLKKNRGNLQESLGHNFIKKDDGFDFLRTKKDLKSRSQKILAE